MPQIKRPLGYSATVNKAAAVAARAAAARVLDRALASAPTGGGREVRKARLEAASAARVEATAAAPPKQLASRGAMFSMLGALDDIAAAAAPKRAAPPPPKNKQALAAALTFTAGAALRGDPFAALAARVDKVREACD